MNGLRKKDYCMKFQCKCGKILSDSLAPNDTQLWVYTDKEWGEKVNIGIIDSVTIPHPEFDVWHCKDCDRIYFFKWGEGAYVKVYGREDLD